MALMGNYYLNQAGGGVGRGDFNIVVRPRRIQQGAGVLSNLLRRGFDYIKPILIDAAKSVGYEGLNFGTNVLNNMGKKPFSDVVRSSAEESLNNIKNKFVNSLNSQFGGMGRKRVLPLPYHQNYEVAMKKRKRSQSSSKTQSKRKGKKKKKAANKNRKKKKKSTKKKKAKKKNSTKKAKKVKRRVKDIFD